MAEVLAFNALHYDLGKVGSLDAVAAPPYDVIDAAQRAALLARSPYNAVAIDLPKPFDPADPDSNPSGNPYAEAAARIGQWRSDGALVQEEAPSIWALTQDYVAPDGNSYSRNGLLVRVRVEDYESGTVRPHERTHPGPLLDRLELTRATGYNLSPIFSLSTEDAWPLVAPSLPDQPWGEARDEDGTVNRLWKVDDPAIHQAVTECLAGAQLLIADGHHRYETARAFRDEVGGDGPHNYTLMSLTGLDDPGLTVFPTHRLLSGFADDPEKQQRLGNGLRELFDVEEVSREEIDPAGETGVGVFGLYDSFHKKAFRLRLMDVAEIDRRLEGKPESYRRLDSAILETLVLKGLAGMSDHDIDERNGLEYAKSVPAALTMVDDGDYDVAFIQRGVPVEQVKAICNTDAVMPPKSTFFFPKVMTGFAFNPVR
ncbi:MAG TPA: DUF1015 domain-containing protein [Solirubrobacterales bacterium]|nr:DUF1015 domain-containing protein [Solirubrobacterales bacterium]